MKVSEIKAELVSTAKMRTPRQTAPCSAVEFSLAIASTYARYYELMSRGRVAMTNDKLKMGYAGLFEKSELVSRLEEARARSSRTSSSSDSPSTSRTPQMDTLFQKLDSMDLSAEQLAAMGSVNYDSLWSSSKIPMPSQEEVLRSMQENGACLAGTACMHAAAQCVRPRYSQRCDSSSASCTVQLLVVELAVRLSASSEASSLLLLMLHLHSTNTATSTATAVICMHTQMAACQAV
eukprot:12154-Heterococcus_DN1.PRE.1